MSNFIKKKNELINALIGSSSKVTEIDYLLVQLNKASNFVEVVNLIVKWIINSPWDYEYLVVDELFSFLFKYSNLYEKKNNYIYFYLFLKFEENKLFRNEFFQRFFYNVQQKNPFLKDYENKLEYTQYDLSNLVKFTIKHYYL